MRSQLKSGFGEQGQARNSNIIQISEAVARKKASAFGRNRMKEREGERETDGDDSAISAPPLQPACARRRASCPVCSCCAHHHLVPTPANCKIYGGVCSTLTRPLLRACTPRQSTRTREPRAYPNPLHTSSVHHAYATRTLYEPHGYNAQTRT